MVSVLVFIFENNCKDIQSVTEVTICYALKFLAVKKLAKYEMLLLRLAGHVAYMGDMRNYAKCWSENLKGIHHWGN
jgi:hypothetical protein